MKPIVVVGSINMDLVTRAQRFPRAGETITGTYFQLHSGGKGANQAVAVARLRHPCMLLGAVGNDVFGEKLLTTLAGYGVDTRCVAVVAGPSGTASIVVSADGENSIVVIPGANAHVTPAYLEQHVELLRNAGMVLVQLEIPVASVEWLVSYCSDHRVPVMLDPAPVVPLRAPLLEKLDWFTPNQTEAEFYSGGGYDIEESLAKLFLSGVHNVVLKRGSDGAVIASRDGARTSVGAFPVSVVDTTAAGDAFNGAFAVALLRGLPTSDCGRFACAAAALSVTRAGAQPSLASSDEVSAFLARAEDLFKARAVESGGD